LRNPRRQTSPRAQDAGRILRLQRALAQVRSGAPAALAAADSGYSDQPHLARDVRALTGSTLRTLAGAGAG